MYLMLSKNIIDQFTGIERGHNEAYLLVPSPSVGTREPSKSDDSNFPDIGAQRVCGHGPSNLQDAWLSNA